MAFTSSGAFMLKSISVLSSASGEPLRKFPESDWNTFPRGTYVCRRPQAELECSREKKSCAKRQLGAVKTNLPVKIICFSKNRIYKPIVGRLEIVPDDVIEVVIVPKLDNNER